MLFVQLRNLSSRVQFGVVGNFAVPLLIGTLFLDRFVKQYTTWNIALSPSALSQSQLFQNTRPS